MTSIDNISVAASIDRQADVPMKLQVELENCYGIPSLDATFDFTTSKAYAIYAPNGAMKSSFAQTFQDVAKNQPSKDRVFPNRTTRRRITMHPGVDLSPDSVLVVRPYDEAFSHSEKTSTLLVNADLRAEYEKLHIAIDEAKDRLLQALRSQASTRKDVEKEISAAFTRSEDKFQLALARIRPELDAQTEAPFSDVKYDVIFDEKVMAVLGTKDFKTAIESYIKKYNELLSRSTYFKAGTFNYYNAATIAKALADNGFFKAKHSIRLNAESSVDLTSEKDLESLITKEKEAISGDANLRKKFGEIEKLLVKNVTVREFQTYIEAHEELLPSLANIDSFKEDLWKSYLYKHKDLYEDLMDKYAAADKRRKEIELQAASERTQWEEVIATFNSRFFVPFKLVAKNQVSVILGTDPILSLGFEFEDRGETAQVERPQLIEVLSTGEKKAFYILNLIFEIEARIKAGQHTVLVVDDVADSFDYRNKYAIIQYLKDISDSGLFNQIVLTHNFDFFRTVQSRYIPYNCCRMASKSSAGITLVKASGIQNVFVKDWKPAFFNDARKRIAAIPFMRNLVEFTRGDADPDFMKLTSLLHWKADTSAITEDDLAGIYNKMFGTNGVASNGSALVADIIKREADECLKAADGANFENKIVLSIAIRLCAERYLIDKIANPKFVADITSTQTPKLLKEYKRLHPTHKGAIQVIERVALMTPENIHLNAFMYEPILDMSDEHLRKLYEDVVGLK